MQIKRLLALVVLSVSGALCVASCAQEPTATPQTEVTPLDERTAETDDSLEGERVGEAQEPAIFQNIHCSQADRGADCMIRCALAGIACPGGQHHTCKVADLGLLYGCRGISKIRTCWYYFEDIHEKCVLNALNTLYCTVGGGAEDD
jgi:hypothetical protein